MYVSGEQILDHDGDLARWVRWMFCNAEEAADSFRCPDTPPLSAAEKRACSQRGIVKGLGDPGKPKPKCPTEPNPHEEAIDLLSQAFDHTTRIGDPFLGFVAAVAAQTIEESLTKELNWDGFAGCRILCAVIPAGKQITRVQGYFAKFRGEPLQQITENQWGDQDPIGWVRVDPDENGVVTEGSQTTVCRNFRAWKERLERPAQLVVDYK
jgi:hypothetical protein